MPARRVSYTKKQFLMWAQERFPEIDWSEIEPYLPLIIFRSRWDQLAERIGIPYTRKYVQNLDSKGLGPANVQI